MGTDGAVVYVRISFDPTGSEVGVATQEKDCRELAAQLGVDVARVYRENDTSAFKQRVLTLPSGERVRRVVRPMFRAMLGDLASGAASCLIVYDLDRAVRDPRDLEDLIDAKVLYGFGVHSVTRSLRLDSDADVAMARVLVAMANKSSADTARRVKRACERKAEMGVWHGSRAPFGYRVEDARLRIVPHQALMIKEAAERVLSGDSVYSVARDWNERGIPSARGCRWGAMVLWRILENPALAGIREYRPLDAAGRRVQHAVRSGPGNWEPILDRATWDMLVAEMRRRKAQRDKSGHNNKRVLPFSGLIRCAACGRKMSKRGERYVCQPTERGVCHRTIFFEETNRIVESAVLRVLSSDSVAQLLRGVAPTDQARRQASAIADVQSRLQALDDDYYDALVDRSSWLRQRSRLTSQMESDERAFRAAIAMQTVEVGNVGSFESEWSRRGPIWKHEVAALVLDRVLVHGSPTDIPRTVVRRGSESAEEYQSRKLDRRMERVARRLELVWRA